MFCSHNPYKVSWGIKRGIKFLFIPLSIISLIPLIPIVVHTLMSSDYCGTVRPPTPLLFLLLLLHFLHKKGEWGGDYPSR